MEAGAGGKLLVRAGLGAVAVAALGVSFLLVGLARAAVATFRGVNIEPFSRDDVPGLLAYVLSLALGGAVAGVAMPLIRSRRSGYLVFAAVGALVATCMWVGIEGPAGFDLPMAIALPVMGAIFGLAFAFGFLD